MQFRDKLEKVFDYKIVQQYAKSIDDFAWQVDVEQRYAQGTVKLLEDKLSQVVAELRVCKADLEEHIKRKDKDKTDKEFFE